MIALLISASIALAFVAILSASVQLGDEPTGQVHKGKARQ